MNDLISRQAAIEAIWDGINYDIYTREVKEILEQLPTVDPVVRRAECRFAETFIVCGEPILTCNNNEGLFRDVPRDGYCYCGGL